MKGDGDGDCCDEDSRPTLDGIELAADVEAFRLGAIIDVISHPTRRKALIHLASVDSELTLAELVEEIKEPVTITDPLRRSVDQTQRVKMQLYHVHAPKLDEEGLATFDHDDRTITITEDGREAMRKLL